MLTFKGTDSDRFSRKGVLEKRGSLEGELVWRVLRYSGGIYGLRGRKRDEGRA